MARLKNILGDTDGVSTISVSEWWLETEEHVGGHGWCVCGQCVRCLSGAQRLKNMVGDTDGVSNVSVVPRD